MALQRGGGAGRLGGLVAACVVGLLALAAVTPAPAGALPGPALRIPPRPAGGIGGVEFARRVEGLPLEERREAVREELRKGNLPEFLRHLRPVTLRQRSWTGRAREATIFVTPDYLAIGSDEDFLRIPMDLLSAIAVARDFGALLPTRKMVDAIYAQASVRLEPTPMTPGPSMRSIGYYRQHNQQLESQLDTHALGELVAGHKKDLVLTNRITPQHRKVAIYGWHRDRDDPIQPLSTIHVAAYADYSHGVRLVANTIVLNGEPRSIYDALSDPRLGKLLSYEGAIPEVRQLMGIESPK